MYFVVLNIKSNAICGRGRCKSFMDFVNDVVITKGMFEVIYFFLMMIGVILDEILPLM